jgi:hypothetical protein
LARTRTCAEVSAKQFRKDVDAIFGPLANEVNGEIVEETFSRFSAPTFALHCFEPAFKSILETLIQETAENDEEPQRSELRRAEFRGASLNSLQNGSLRSASYRGSLRIAEAPTLRKAVSLGGEAPLQDGVALREASRGEAPLRGGAGAKAPLGSSTVRQPMRTDVEDGIPAAVQKTLRHRLGRGLRVSPQAAEEEVVEVVADHHQKEAFFDLAVHAHCANFRCWMVMEAAAAEILNEPIWGTQLSELTDFSDDVSQKSLGGEHLAAWAAELGGESLKNRLDEAVLPHALRSVALDAHPAFIAALEKLVCAADSKVSLYKTNESTAVKSAQRMSVKVQNYKEGEWPRAALITDPLRATIVCDDCEAIVQTYNALQSEGSPFRALRLKNKLAFCTKPFNLHLNYAFDRGDGTALITVEVQIVPNAVNAVMGASHKFYTLSRAPGAKALAE